jgi:hypothetical protein
MHDRCWQNRKALQVSAFKIGILELGYEGPNVCATKTPIGNVAYSMFLRHLAILIS